MTSSFTASMKMALIGFFLLIVAFLFAASLVAP
jgi:hypothetical protein